MDTSHRNGDAAPPAGGRYYTILVLRHREGRFRKLHVSRNFVVALGVTILVLSGLALWSPHLLLRLQVEGARLDGLQHQNERLTRENERFESDLTELAQRLDETEQRASRIASALGVEVFDTLAPAGGDGAPRLHGRQPLLLHELDALENRSLRLTDSLEQLDQSFRTRARVLASTPSLMPVDGWFSHGFGWRKDPFTRKRQFHRGIDIVADRGTPVRASADGVVKRATREAQLGKTVDLDHGRGYVTRYAHMDTLLVKPGQQVKRGELVGRVGSTGRSTGPHLHYEVFRDGRRVNPWKYLGRR